MQTPRSLSKPARVIWKAVVTEHPHLSTADTLQLAHYCELHAQLDMAIAKAKESGPLATSEKGTAYMAPALQVISMLEPKVVRLARELRIICSTRPAVSVRSKPAAQPRIARFQVS